MKCKKCGFKGRDINSMRKHYLKAHPGAMKAKRTRSKRAPEFTWREQESAYKDYARVTGKCPYCGKPL